MSEGIFGKDADLAQRLKDRSRSTPTNTGTHTRLGRASWTPWSWTFWPTSVTPAV